MKLNVTINELSVGDKIEVVVTKVVHGGHFLAHHDGKTIFVRGALDGERVEISITSKRKKVYFAQATSIIDSSPHRVSPPCQSSHTCGGCDFQYVDITYQRILKSQVLHESLRKFSGLDVSLIDKLIKNGVQPLSATDHDGSNWRYRSRFVWQNGWHMRKQASHELVSTPQCTIITQQMRDALAAVVSATDGEYFVVEGNNGVSLGNSDTQLSGPTMVDHALFDSQWSIPPQAFWQANPNLIPAIADFLGQLKVINQGDNWWDLYGGAGVFAAYLAQQVGHVGHVTSVDGDPMATRAARSALHNCANIRLIHSDVEQFLDQVDGTAGAWPRGILVDPPRSGAGESVARKIMGFEPDYIVYIACDPVALARDIKTLSEKYFLSELRSWDAFPMSHHFETVALLRRDLS